MFASVIVHGACYRKKVTYEGRNYNSNLFILSKQQMPVEFQLERCTDDDKKLLAVVVKEH